MKSSKAILFSVFLSAVILVVIGAVTSNVFANKPIPPTTPAPQVVQAYQQREAQYNQLLQQANDQLTRANEQLQALQSQVNQMQQPAAAQPATQPAPVSDANISPDKAAEIGTQVAGAGEQPQKTPALVDFQGKTAYEVSFEKGIVYVDAKTGDVLYNGTVPQQISADKAAQIASDYLGHKSVLNVDEVTIHDVPLYRVAFRDGTLAWVDHTGQITDIQLPQRVVIHDAGSSSHPSSGGGNSTVTTPPPATGGSPVYHDDDSHDSFETHDSN